MVKIIDNNRSFFKTVKIGDMFEYEDRLYLALYHPGTNKFTAVDIKNSVEVIFEDNEIIRIVDAEIIVK